MVVYRANTRSTTGQDCVGYCAPPKISAPTDLGRRCHESRLCMLLEALRSSKSKSIPQTSRQVLFRDCQIFSNCLLKSNGLPKTKWLESKSSSKTRTTSRMSSQAVRLVALFVGLACGEHVYLQSYAQCHHPCNQS